MIEQATATPVCRNCAFYSYSEMYGAGDCVHPAARAVNPVGGFCNPADLRAPGAACGPSGQLWQLRALAPPRRLLGLPPELAIPLIGFSTICSVVLGACWVLSLVR